MSLFTLVFPTEAARLARAERVVGRLSELSGYDEWSDPLLAGIEDEVTAGHDIKVAELYCQAAGCGVGEARIAVASLRAGTGS